MWKEMENRKVDKARIAKAGRKRETKGKKKRMRREKSLEDQQ